MAGHRTARNIGLAGAVFTMVGYVVGASIFILPGALAADTGPAAFLAYLIAGVLAALTCVVGAELGSAVPVSGAINVTASRVLGPLFGFVGVWAPDPRGVAGDRAGGVWVCRLSRLLLPRRQPPAGGAGHGRRASGSST